MMSTIPSKSVLIKRRSNSSKHYFKALLVAVVLKNYAHTEAEKAKKHLPFDLSM